MILTDTLYKRVLRGFDMSLAISTLEYLQTRLNIPDSKLQTYADKSVEEIIQRLLKAIKPLFSLRRICFLIQHS